jgi:hypothetical protein
MKFLVTENQFRLVISDVESHLLNEGVNDETALSLLKASGMENYEQVFNFLKSKDKSKNNKSLPAMSLFYTLASSRDKFIEIIKTFEKLSTQPNSPDVILDRKSNTIKVLNNVFDANEFDKFKDFVEHYYYEEGSDEDTSKKLLSTEENLVFENDKYLVYEAPSARVCIDLFGRDNKQRKYVYRSYCIGAGQLDAPEGSWYGNYRKPTGDWRVTFYIIIDKEKLEEAKNLPEQSDNPLTVVSLGVRQSSVDNSLEYLAWDKNNSGPGQDIAGFNNVKDYVDFLESQGVNIKSFLPKPYVDLTDSQIDNMTNNWGNNDIFDSLTPKQKYKYINERAKNLTPYQVKFVMKFMPPALISNFVKSWHRLDDLPTESFELLTTNLKKSYINSKLIQLYTDNQNFTQDEFIKLATSNNEIKEFAIKHIINSLSPNSKHENRNKEETKTLLSFLDPLSFFESLKSETNVSVNSSNFKSNELPENIGDYLENVVELEFKNLEIKNIPPSIGKCKNLATLHIWSCHKLKKLPDEIGQLTNLDELVVGNCALANIPQTIGNLKNLTSLSFHSNNIKSIPESLSDCTSLQMLKLEENQISDISENVFFKQGVPLETESGEPNVDAFKFESLAFINLDDNPLSNEAKNLLEKVENIGLVHVS